MKGYHIKEDKALPKVFCGECRHFQRDTEGRNRRNDTGEYFMGICLKGIVTDGLRKQFADKPRVCAKFRRAE